MTYKDKVALVQTESQLSYVIESLAEIRWLKDGGVEGERSSVSLKLQGNT